MNNPYLPYAGIAVPTYNKKEKKPKDQKELKNVHLPLMKLAKQHPICQYHLQHYANERACSPWYGNLLKQMGVTSGVHDLFLMWPTAKFSGYWIELKYGKNKLSFTQKVFFKKAQTAGAPGSLPYKVDCFWDYKKAWNSILEYLGEAPHFAV